MLLTFTLAALVAAAPAQPVLVLDLEAVGVSADEASAATRVVAAAADDVDGVVVMSTADLRRLAELEGEKAAVGCTESSCLTDLAGALGAQRVVFGSVSRLGSTVTVVLSLYDVSTQTSTRRSFDVVDVQRMSALLRANTTALFTGVVDEPPPKNIVPLAVGVGAVVVGGVTAGVMELLIQDPGGDGDTKSALQIVGVAGVAVAAVGVVVSVIGAVIFMGDGQ